MRIAYEVRCHGIPGNYRWRIEVRTEEADEHKQRPLLADWYQPTYQQCHVTQEAALRAGEAFLELVAGCPPLA